MADRCLLEKGELHVHSYTNPIITGFAPDPTICRCGTDYYIATSSFEWFPGIPVYHSKDLVNWTLKTHILTDETMLNMSYIASAKGVWAPCLQYCEADKLFYLCYNVMHSMNARYFDVDNYMITAPSIDGPWSELIYMHSAGFDGSLFHDDDGRKWFVSMEWETRDGWHKPGVICLCEYDPIKKEIMGLPKRIFSGATRRGCIEGPHLYKHDGLYYLLCAEGGTGYGHAVTMARATNIDGPYEPDPKGPILTSCADFDEMDNDDSRKLNRFNPDPTQLIQKAGHGSFVETPDGEVYMTYLCGRPLLPKLRCTLGRECSLQKMAWTADGWLRKADSDSALAQTDITLPKIAPVKKVSKSCSYDFKENTLPLDWRAPRISPTRFATVKDGRVLIRGAESISSTHAASFLGHRLTGLQDSFEARMEFTSLTYQQYAGIAIYYDQMDYLLLRKVWHEETQQEMLELHMVDNGDRIELPETRAIAPKGAVTLRLEVQGKQLHFFWKADNGSEQRIGGAYPVDHYSDEYCQAGEFTGASVGLFAVDALLHRQIATFDHVKYVDLAE